MRHIDGSNQGEMHFSASTPESWVNLDRRDGVAYAAQESWVQNETIRENILFGEPYDDARYRKGDGVHILLLSISPFLSSCAVRLGQRLTAL